MTIFNRLSFLTAAVTALIAPAQAATQDNAVKFCVLTPQCEALPASAASVVNQKIVAALNRSQAATEDICNVFTVKPVIDIVSLSESEGMMREVANVSAEMVLSAVNSVDGTIYHSITVPLKGAAAGGKEAAIKSMVNSIKPTDPVYVRFVRTARQRIADHYAENCGNIIGEAQRLVLLKRYEEAASYLSAVPASVSCYDQASVLLGEVTPFIGQVPDTIMVEHVVEVPVDRIVEVPAQPDTVVVEKIVPVEVPVQQPAAPATQPNPLITIDGTNLDFRILSCRGDMLRQRITIKARITNTQADTPRPYVYFENAFSDDGVQYTNLLLNDTDMRSRNIAMPDGIPVKVDFVIKNVKTQVGMLAYVEIFIRGIKVSVRRLPVNWM